MPDRMGDQDSQMESNYVIARVVPDDKKRFTKAAERLRVSVSDMIVSAMRVVSGEVLGSNWECRRIHVSGDRILAIGEEPPTMNSGIPIPVTSCKIVAPLAMWKALEGALGDHS